MVDVCLVFKRFWKKSPDPAPENEAEEEEKEPQEIVLKVYIHCEGCAMKIRRCLKRLEGVEDVMTDLSSGEVIVKGDNADPLKVLERLQKKSNRQVELLSPIPEPKPAEGSEETPVGDENPKPEEETGEVVTVVLRVNMHCESCPIEIQKTIMRMQGVENVEPDYNASQVTVTGVFTTAKLVEYIYKKTHKHAAVVEQDSQQAAAAVEEDPQDAAAVVEEDPPPQMSPEKEEETKGEQKPKEGKKKKKKEKKKPKEETVQEEDKAEGTKDSGDGEAKPADEGDGAPAEGGEAPAAKVVKMKKNEYDYEYKYKPPWYLMENRYAYPHYFFSDENPNSCTVM